MIIVRYADDLVVGFEHEADAHRFLEVMRQRFEEFALTLHPEKTRMIEFGRHAAAKRAKRGLGKPETFNFLGFTLHLRQDAPGQVPAQKEDPVRPRAGKAQGDQGGVATANAPVRSPNRGNGCGKWSEASSPTTRCRPIVWPSRPSDAMSSNSGGERSGGVARETRPHGSG